MGRSKRKPTSPFTIRSAPSYLSAEWKLRDIDPDYRLAVRYVKRATKQRTSQIVNDALGFFLTSKWPRLLEMAQQCIEDGVYHHDIEDAEDCAERTLRED